MIEIENVRKVVVFSYDTSIVLGSHVTSFAAKPESEGGLIEKKTNVNRGHVSFAFPIHHHGDVVIEVHGSREGVDKGTLSV